MASSFQDSTGVLGGVGAVLDPVSRDVAEPADVALGWVGDLPIRVAEVPHQGVEGGIRAALDPVTRDLAELAHISQRGDGLVRASRGGGRGRGPVLLLRVLPLMVMMVMVIVVVLGVGLLGLGKVWLGGIVGLGGNRRTRNGREVLEASVGQLVALVVIGAGKVMLLLLLLVVVLGKWQGDLVMMLAWMLLLSVRGELLPVVTLSTLHRGRIRERGLGLRGGEVVRPEPGGRG